MQTTSDPEPWGGRGNRQHTLGKVLPTDSVLLEVSWFSARSNFMHIRNHFFKTSSMPHKSFIIGQIGDNKAPWRHNNGVNTFVDMVCLSI